mgnify:CR=1 FL=1
MLKHDEYKDSIELELQPPSGGCVLKHILNKYYEHIAYQPPSGGCVLKRLMCGECELKIVSRLQAAVC